MEKIDRHEALSTFTFLAYKNIKPRLKKLWFYGSSGQLFVKIERIGAEVFLSHHMQEVLQQGVLTIPEPPYVRPQNNGPPGSSCK